MNRHDRLRKANAGMAMVMAMVFVAVVAVTLAAFSARQIQQRRNADIHYIHSRAFDALDGAVARSKKLLEATGNGAIGLDGWQVVYNSKKEVDLPAFDSASGNPVSLPSDPSNLGTWSIPPPQILACSVRWGNDGIDNNGDGVIDNAVERGIHAIYAAAKYRNITRQAEVIYAAENVNAWNNAIFAGEGSAFGVIRGNVNVGGSVHILGNNLLAGGTAIAMSGNSGIQNNYNGVPDDLLVRVPALPSVNINGTQASTLSARLRVKHGMVSLGGSGTIGSQYSNGSIVKQQMNGT